MAHVERIAMSDAQTFERIPAVDSLAVDRSEPKGRSIAPYPGWATGFRYLLALVAASAGIAAAALAPSLVEGNLVLLLCCLAFAGGLLSTWSPCGYSSLSTLRVDEPGDPAAVLRWMPTLFAHALGYAIGGAVLAAVMSVVAWSLPVQGFTPLTLAGLAAAALLYGLHQLGILRMPRPQLRLQVSHGARMDLPKWATGVLYGLHLGLNFATYVRSPILYVVVLACVLSGSPLTALALVLSLNLGRFLPLLANLLPASDRDVQRWMAAKDRAAVVTDGGVLVSFGSLLLATVATGVFP